jgi:cytochrome c biogenesis protein CcdA
MYFKNELLPDFKKKYKDKVVWKHLEINTNEKAYVEFYNLNIARGKKNFGVPSLLVGDELLTGVNDIKNLFDFAVDKALEKIPEEKQETPQNNLRQIYENISLPAVLFFGLLDGVNPCAFAVIVFFISFLSVYGYNRREIVYVGSAYCLSVFGVYFLLGLGVFKTLYLISGFYTVIKIFYWAVAGLCFLFFGFSIYDLIKYLKTGKSEGMLLQLPKSFKIAINKLFGKYLRAKSGSGIFKLTIAALVVGFLVSLIEAVCTGQVYVPVLAFISKEPQLKTKAIFYLALYNVMFIMPLVLVFVLSVLGYKSKSFDSFLKKHLALIKVLLALVFLGLGLMLLIRV